MRSAHGAGGSEGLDPQCGAVRRLAEEDGVVEAPGAALVEAVARLEEAGRVAAGNYSFRCGFS